MSEGSCCHLLTCYELFCMSNLIFTGQFIRKHLSSTCHPCSYPISHLYGSSVMHAVMQIQVKNLTKWTPQTKDVVWPRCEWWQNRSKKKHGVVICARQAGLSILETADFITISRIYIEWCKKKKLLWQKWAEYEQTGLWLQEIYSNFISHSLGLC